MLKVVICSDVDPNVLGYGVPAPRFDVCKEKLGWKGVSNIPRIKAIGTSVKGIESNQPISHDSLGRRKVEDYFWGPCLPAQIYRPATLSIQLLF